MRINIFHDADRIWINFRAKRVVWRESYIKTNPWFVYLYKHGKEYDEDGFC